MGYIQNTEFKGKPDGWGFNILFIVCVCVGGQNAVSVCGGAYLEGELMYFSINVKALLNLVLERLLGAQVLNVCASASCSWEVMWNLRGGNSWWPAWPCCCVFGGDFSTWAMRQTALLCHVLLPWWIASDKKWLGHSVIDRNMDRHCRGPGKQRHSKERHLKTVLLPLAIRLLMQWLPRTWDLPRNLMLGEGQGWSLVPGRSLFSVKRFHIVLTIS